MSFIVKERVLSKIVSGMDTDRWIPCEIEKINKDGTYRLRVLNPAKYNTFKFADSVNGNLLRKETDTRINVGIVGGDNKSDEKEPHILLKIPRQRGGNWDKVNWYWQKYPAVMKAVRDGVLKKVRAGYNKYDKEMPSYDWTLAEESKEYTLYSRQDKNSKMTWKFVYDMPPRKDIPVYDLNKKTIFDNFQRAQASTRYDFELLDSWTVKEKYGPDLHIQITSEKMKIPWISDRWGTAIIALREDKTGFVRLETSIKHPLKKDIKKLVRSRFEHFGDHRLLKNGTLRNTIYVNLDIGGRVPTRLFNLCFPLVLTDYAKFVSQMREYDFSKDSDWNRYYEEIGSTDMS